MKNVLFGKSLLILCLLAVSGLCSNSLMAQSGGAMMESWQKLNLGEFLSGDRGSTKITLQMDGDLVISRNDNIVWRSSTTEKGVKSLGFKQGVLSLFGDNNVVLWSADQKGKTGTMLFCGADKVKVNDGNTGIWGIYNVNGSWTERNSDPE